MEWIDVNERLPKYEKGEIEIVLVSGIEREERYVYYAETHAYGEEHKKEDVFSIPGWSKMNVTHWMPLPNPPKPKQQ